MTHPPSLVLAAAFVAAVLPADVAGAAGVVDVETRGETVRLLVEDPEPYLDFAKDPPLVQPKIVGVVVLFAGGGGVLGISELGAMRRLSGNFLVRSSGHFREKGFVTAVIDGPTDQPGDLYGFRGSENHARDVAAVIRHLRGAYGVPVWLAGTSRGTNSVANAAVRLKGPEGPDGIVLTATMLESNNKGDQVLEYALDEIRLPVVVAHHRKDGCSVTPPRNVDSMVSALKNARVLAVLWYEGGRDDGPSCQAKGHHGFSGIEQDVVYDIAAAITSAIPGALPGALPGAK